VVNNNLQRNATIIPPTENLQTIDLQNLKTGQLNKALSRFGTVKANHSDNPIEQIKIATSNQVFSYSEWD